MAKRAAARTTSHTPEETTAMAPAPDEIPSTHDEGSAEQDGQPVPEAAPTAEALIDKEKDAATARGVNLEGLCDQFVGKSLEECLALQPRVMIAVQHTGSGPTCI